MEKGKVNEESQKIDSTEELKGQIATMMAKLNELEKDKNTKIVGPTGGFSMEQMAEIVKLMKQKPEGSVDYNSYVESYDIDANDYDEVGVLFTAPSTGIVIVDDIRKGVKVATPYKNVIFFMYEGQVQSRDERGKVVLNTFSCYLSRSKKEQEWLRNHTTYGVKFNESGKQALSADSMRMQKLQAYMLGISNLDNASLFARCKSAGLPVSNDVVSMRMSLAEKQLNDYEASHESASARMVREREEQELFLNDTTKFTRQ